MKPRRKTIGIFGGSFNPVHNGHVTLAKAIVASGEVDEVWLTLSPQNPLKKSKTLADDVHRLAMLHLAVDGEEGLEVCDVELSLPRPSYTINTLRHLTSERPDCRFRLIVGADNYAVFDRWREHDRLIADYGLIVYPRQGFDAEAGEKGVTIVEAPLYDVSSTEIRAAIADGDDFSTMVPSSVADYIKENKLYGYGRE